MRCNCESSYCDWHNRPQTNKDWPYTEEPATEPCPNRADGEWTMDHVGAVCALCAERTMNTGGASYIDHHEKENADG